MKKLLLLIILSLTGFGCNGIEKISFQNDDAKFINKIAIIGPEESLDMKVNITGDSNMFYLMMGPAIVPQLMMAYGTYAANKEEAVSFNDIIFDLNIEKIVRKKFRDELVAGTNFNPVIQEEIDAPNIKHIINKYPKTQDDYIKIAGHTGVDTIIDLSVYSYGIKDPGILWDPNVILTADAKMVRISDNKTLWQTRIKENARRRTTGFEYHLYKENNGELLRYELDAAADIVAKTLVRDMGFAVKGNINSIREMVVKKVMESIDTEANLIAALASMGDDKKAEEPLNEKTDLAAATAPGQAAGDKANDSTDGAAKPEAPIASNKNNKADKTNDSIADPAKPADAIVSDYDKGEAKSIASGDDKGVAKPIEEETNLASAMASTKTGDNLK